MISLRPGGCVGGPRPRTSPTEAAATYAPGEKVLAKYSAESRSWKKATLVALTSGGKIATVQFDGYQDQTTLPIERIKRAGRDTNGRKRAPPPARPPPVKATQFKKHASCPSEQAVAAARSCLSKLAPGNFEKIAATLLAIEIDGRATLDALIDVMFERAVAESAFCPIYARLFAKCADECPACPDPEVGEVTFRRALLGRAQSEFERADEGGLERARCLGLMIFLGELWLSGLLSERIVHECVAKVLASVDEGEDDGDGKLRADAIEAACTLLGKIGKRCDAEAKGRARMDAYVARVRGWAADKARVPSMRIRFKLMDLVEARERGWSDKTAS